MEESFPYSQISVDVHEALRVTEDRLDLRYFDAVIWELLTISVLCSVNGEHFLYLLWVL